MFLVEHLTGRQKELLSVFEKEMQKNYLQKYQALSRDTLEIKINKIRNRYTCCHKTMGISNVVNPCCGCILFVLVGHCCMIFPPFLLFSIL